MINTKILGEKGERLVASYLKEQGFQILACNFSARCGEVDLIAQRKEVIVFVEVKTRKTQYFPISSVVNQSKQRRIMKTAEFYILKNNIENKVIRFDVAIVVWGEGNYKKGNHKIEYIVNAF